MRGKEIQDCAVRGHIANRPAQAIRRQAGQVEQALRPPLVRQHPAERGQRQGRGVFNRIFTSVKNCQQSVINISQGEASIGSEAFGG